jgi:YD repeat-containing protein
VTTRSAGILLALVVLCGAFTLRARAQQSCITSVTCGTYTLSGLDNRGCVPALPAGAYGCFSSGPFEATCLVRNNVCHPAPECPTCNLHGGHPIDFASGDTYITQSDLRIPGLGGGLTLARTWNSVWPAKESPWRVGLFGTNWRSTYEERVLAGSDGYLKYSRGDGGFWSFGFSGYDSTGSNPTFTPIAPTNQTATLTEGATSWTLSFQNGETRTFDPISGYLTSISDRNGNTTQLSYDTAYRLLSVSDAAGHHLYFAYASPSSYFVTGVSSDVGVSLSYLYDAQGRLIKVTKPDQTTVSFQYDSNSLISAVLDSNGKVLESHTYNTCGQGLTSSRSGGVDGLTVSYPPSCALGLP